MKSKLAIAKITTVAVVVLASLSSAMATTQTPPLTVSEHGAVWTVDTLKLFSGKDVYSMVTEYWILYPNPDGTYYPVYYSITPYKTSLTDSQVKLWFSLPSDVLTSDGTKVTLTLNDGTSIVVTGPGWVWSNIH